MLDKGEFIPEVINLKKVVFSSLLPIILMVFIFTSKAYGENKHLQDETSKGKDSIEWVELWDFPSTREGKLERMLTTELQRKILFALQEKNFLKPGKEHAYRFDPFQVTDMRTIDGGFYQLTVLATVQRVFHNNKLEENNEKEKYRITFVHNYDLGFVVTECQQITDK